MRDCCFQLIENGSQSRQSKTRCPCRILFANPFGQSRFACSSYTNNFYYLSHYRYEPDSLSRLLIRPITIVEREERFTNSQIFK